MHFLLDGMLGKLARWLRMIGYEATYKNDLEDRDLLTLAKQDSLILLTSDAELYRTAVARGVESFLVEGHSEPERLASLGERYGLDLRIDTTISRCPVCGFPLREAAKKEVKQIVPPATFKVYNSFWVCTNPKCAKVYWQGSHWKKIEETLASARQIVDSRGKAKNGTDAKSTPEPGTRQSPSATSTRSHKRLSGKKPAHKPAKRNTRRTTKKVRRLRNTEHN